MRVVLITQDDPFYLAKNIQYLIDIFPKNAEIVACVLFDVAPFGKKATKIDQAKETYNVFGFNFLMHYGIKFLKNKFNPKTKIKQVLQTNNIPQIILEKRINNKASLAIIEDYKPDLLISIAGNQIFKQPLIDLAPKGCLNLHTSLLPKYRGLMPTFWVMKHNEKETGVSVFYVDEGIDSGPIVVQKRISIGNRTQEQLIWDTKALGMEAIASAVDLIMKDNVTPQANPKSEMSYYSRPTKQDVLEFRAAGKKFY